MSILGSDKTTHPKEGWKWVILGAAIENLTDYVFWAPPSFCGKLIDTGGYERELSGGQDGELYGSYQVILPPHTRAKAISFRTSLPENQDVKGLSFQMSNTYGSCLGAYGEPFNIEISSSDIPNVKYPFDEIPSHLQNLTPPLSLKYEQPGDYRYELSNIRLEKGEGYPGKHLILADMKAENLGGYDLCDSQHRPQWGSRLVLPFVLGVDTDGITFGDAEGKIPCIEPGAVKEETIKMGYSYFLTRDQTLPDFLYLALVDGPGGVTVADTIIRLKESK